MAQYYIDPVTGERRKATTGSESVPSSPIRRSPAMVEPEVPRPSVRTLRGKEYRRPTQTELMLQYENLGDELTNPNRTTETVQSAIRQRSAILGQLNRDSQGRVQVPPGVQRTSAGMDYTDANLPRRETVVAPDRMPPSPPAPADAIANERPYQVKGADGNFYRLSENELNDLTAQIGERNTAQSPIQERRRSGGIPGVVGGAVLNAVGSKPVQFIGDRIADVLTGGRVSEQQAAAAAERMRQQEASLAEQNTENRALGDRLNSGIPDVSDGPVSQAVAESPLAVMGNTENTGNTGGGDTVAIYRNEDGSFSDQPMSDASTVYSQGSVASQPNDARARENVLRRAKTWEEGVADLQRRNQYAAEVEAARRRNAAGPIRARQFGGGAGDGFMSQVAEMRDQATKAYNKALRRGKNSKAAARAAEAYGIGIRDLVDAQGDRLRADTQRYGIDRRSDVDMASIGLGYDRLSADQQYRAADLQQRYAQLDSAARQAYGAQFADQLDASAKRAAASMLPQNVNPDDKDRLMGEMEIRYRSNLPSNYAQLNPREQAEADQQARAYGGLLYELSQQAGFDYYSMGDLLSAGRIPQQDLSFWRSFIEDGPLDAAWGELSGRTEITLPGSTNTITVQNLRSLSRMNRRALREVFDPARR